MAEEKKNNNVFFKGSKQTVTVEESADDVLVVCLEYSGTIYRGALLNVTNRVMPCGVNVLRLQSNLWTPHRVSDEKDGQKDKDKGIDDSAVCNRFSYKNEPLAPLPERTIAPPKVSNRGYKEKIVRNIRLRPRQILCAKCKTTCSDNQENKPSSANDSELKSATNVTLPPPAIPLKISIKKPNLSGSSVKNSRQNKPVIQKTSPIIKISFNNPQGQGTVVNIPRKIQNSEHSESENEDGSSKNTDIQSGVLAPRRVKKSLRKVKDKLAPYPTHSKHGKHKKHKHKHDKKLSHELNPVVALSPLNLENFNNENCDVTTTVSKDSSDQPYRSPLRTKVIMKRERSASGSMSYVYQAQRVGNSPNMPDESTCKKNLTINLRRVDHEDEKVDCESEKNDFDEENLGPLMMRIQTKSVNKVMLDDQRTICTGDIVWGKIHGFPWWPGRVESIKISQKPDGSILYQQAHVSWFGSSTRSDIACSELYNFLEEFEVKFNKKKRGPYRIAIKEATRQARGLAAISEETESKKPELLPDDLPLSETDCDVDIEAVSSGRNSPMVGSYSSPALITVPSPVPSPVKYVSRSPPDLSPQTTAYSPLYSSVTMTSPKYSPISMTSPKCSPSRSPNSALSTPKYSPIPTTSPQYQYSPVPFRSPRYSPNSVTSPRYTSSQCPTTLPTYAPAPSTSPFYSTTPKYSPVPMTSFQCSLAPVTSPYLSSVDITSPYSTQTPVTSPFYSHAPVTSPYFSQPPVTSHYYSQAPVTSPYYSQASVTSPYYSQASVTSPYYSQAPVTSPYYSQAPVTSPLHSPGSTGSSPKPLARYSPKYSPVTPTPSPLHSPVMASPVQCV